MRPIETDAPGSMSAANVVTIGSATRDPSGANRPAMINKEVISLTTRSKRTIDLTGWTVTDIEGGSLHVSRGKCYLPRHRDFASLGRGANTDTDFYADWGWRWNDEGDTARIHDAAGTLIVTCSYTSAAPALNC